MAILSDPLIDQMLQSEMARGAAHEVFLRLSGSLAHAMFRAISRFQMALIKALMDFARRDSDRV